MVNEQGAIGVEWQRATAAPNKPFGQPAGIVEINFLLAAGYDHLAKCFSLHKRDMFSGFAPLGASKVITIINDVQSFFE